MKFTLNQVKYFYKKREKEKLEKLNFKFKEDGKGYFCDTTFKPEIEINTLEELVNFVKKYGRIILNKREIIIYNDYIE